MKIEHFALQVAEPVEMAAWYVKHLGCTLARSGGEPAYMQFLKDSSGSVMVELYNNPKVAVPNYAEMDPLLLHLAFLSDNPVVDRDRLVTVGAKVVNDLVVSPLGDQLIMLRDPWNVAVQLIKRANPMLASR